MADESSWFERITNTLNKWANWVACVAAMAMMTLVCCDIILRSFRHPLKGSYDIVGLLCVVLVAFAMGYTQILKRHTTVSLIVERLSPRAQGVISSITTIVSICLFGLVTYASFALARRSWLSSEVSMTLGIPLSPLICVVAIGCVLICLALAVDLIRAIDKAVRG